MRRPPESTPVPRFLQRLHHRLAEKASPQPLLKFDARLFTYLLAIVLLGGLLWLLAPILAPFLSAAILAYIFNPLVSLMERKGCSRSLATGIAVLLLILLVALMLVIILPLFYKEIAQLSQQIPSFIERLKTELLPWLQQRFDIKLDIDPSSLRQMIADNAQDAGGVVKKLFASLSVGGLAVLGFLINLVLVPVVLFYLLRDWGALMRNVEDLIPRQLHATTRSLSLEIDAVLSEFLRGQLAVMGVMAAFYVVSLWLVGLEFALPVGLITGLLVFIPYLGSGSGLVLGTIAAFMQFPSMTGVILVWVVFGVGQLIEGFFVTPRLVGERIGLHPVAVLFALLAFGQVFGFFGVLLALPVSAAILVGLRHLKAHYRQSSLYR
ncbi:MAG: AI-2E family transporter [Betaproteobacteria bacterium]|nr:AI-2E family transporter [Betaproteobacteria bacterium]